MLKLDEKMGKTDCLMIRRESIVGAKEVLEQHPEM